MTEGRIPGKTNVTRIDLLDSKNLIGVDVIGKRYISLYMCPKSFTLNPYKPPTYPKIKQMTFVTSVSLVMESLDFLRVHL